MLHYQKLLFVPEIISTKLISRYYDNFLIEFFGINKNKESIVWKYYWPSLKKDVEVYTKDCNICFASKTVRHKLYSNLQALPVPTYW